MVKEELLQTAVNPPTGRGKGKRETWLYFLSLALVTALLILIGLGGYDLMTPDEPRVAGILAEMAREGNLAVPKLNGTPFLEKPPLYFWAGSTVMHLLGETVLTARLTSAIAGIAGVLVLFLLARSMGFSPLGAFLSGFVLATSPRYWILARRCISDMTLCFFITCAMTCYFEARRDPQNTKVFYFLLFVLSLSGAFMSKGLVGLAIPLASLAAWRIVTTKPSLQDFMLLFAGGVLCLLPFVIWLLYLYGALGGDAVYQMVWTQNFGRFTGDFAAHLKPFYFYVTVFPVQFLPWTLFLPLGVMQYLTGIPAGNKDNHSRFVFSWFIGTFILLSLSASKRGIYLIPLYPAAALLVGTTLGAILEGKSAPGRQYRIAFLILLALTVFAGPGFFGMGIYFKQPFVTYALLSLLVFCPALWAVLRFRKGDTAGSLKITLATLGMSFIVVGWWCYPLFTRDDSFTPLFQKCDQLQAEGFKISLYEPRETLRGAAVFYLKKCMPELYGEQKLREFLDTEEKGVLLCEKKRIKNNTGQFDVGETFKVSRRKYVLVKKGQHEQKEE